MATVLLLGLAALSPASALARPDLVPTLVALERDLAAAQAHAAVLRERSAAGAPEDPGAAAAGIADGGGSSSLAALRLAVHAVDRRMEQVRLATPASCNLACARSLLALRAALGQLIVSVEAVAEAHILAVASGDHSPSAIDAVDAALVELSAATASLAAQLRAEG
jgi:hypothetical protein